MRASERSLITQAPALPKLMLTSWLSWSIGALMVTMVPPLREPALGVILWAESCDDVIHDIDWLLVEKSLPLLLTSTTTDPRVLKLCSVTTHMTMDEVTCKADAVSSAAPNLHTESRELTKCFPTTVIT